MFEAYPITAFCDDPLEEEDEADDFHAGFETGVCGGVSKELAAAPYKLSLAVTLAAVPIPCRLAKAC